MLSKLLYLRAGELARVVPFFVLYLVLFGAFALADGLAQTLFIEHGGRVGGIAGGALLQHLTEALGLVNLLGVFVGLCAAGIALLELIARRCPPVSHPQDHVGDPGLVPPAAHDGRDVEAEARASYAG